MAPEQAEGRRVGPPADVYALGLVLYEAFAGRHPVRGAGPAATARRLGANLPSLARSRRDLPAGLVGAVDRAVRPRPGERGSLADLHAALTGAVLEVSDEGGTLASPALDRRLPRGTGRASAAAAAGGLAALAAAWAPVAGGATPAEALGVPVGLVGLGAAAVGVRAPARGLGGAGRRDRRGGGRAAGRCSGRRARGGRRPGGVPAPPSARRPGMVGPGARARCSGIAACAAGFCALAGQARRPLRRAALGAAGFLWVALAEALAGRDLYLGAAPGTGPPADWAGSARDAVTQALEPLATSGALLGALVWAMAALVLPWVVRGRRPLADGIAAAGWAGALAVAGAAVAGIVEAGSHPRGGLAGPALAAVLAVALRWLRGPDPPPLEAPPAD